MKKIWKIDPHYFKIISYSAMFIISLTGWIIIFLILFASSQNYYNYIGLYTNRYNELYTEIVLVIILISYTLVFFSSLILIEIKKDKKRYSKRP